MTTPQLTGRAHSPGPMGLEPRVIQVRAYGVARQKANDALYDLGIRAA